MDLVGVMVLLTTSEFEVDATRFEGKLIGRHGVSELLVKDWCECLDWGLLLLLLLDSRSTTTSGITFVGELLFFLPSLKIFGP